MKIRKRNPSSKGETVAKEKDSLPRRRELVTFMTSYDEEIKRHRKGEKCCQERKWLRERAITKEVPGRKLGREEN